MTVHTWAVTAPCAPGASVGRGLPAREPRRPRPHHSVGTTAMTRLRPWGARTRSRRPWPRCARHDRTHVGTPRYDML